jgi:hypothetical protein
MYFELFSNFFDVVQLMDAIYVYPCCNWFIFEGETFVNSLYSFFIKMVPIILDACNLYLFALLFSDVYWSSWRKTRLCCKFLCKTRRYSAPNEGFLVAYLIFFNVLLFASVGFQDYLQRFSCLCHKPEALGSLSDVQSVCYHVRDVDSFLC